MKRLLFGLFASALILATGCDEIGIPGAESGLKEGSDAILLDAKITAFDANDSEAFDDGNLIGAYVITAGAIWANNAQFTHSKGTFKGAKSEKWYTDSLTRATIVAYHPYMEGMSADSTGVISSIQFSVQSNQNSVEALRKSDLMGAVIDNVLPSSAPIVMNFRHLLSRLDMQIICEDEAVTVESVEIIGLKSSITLVLGREVQNPEGPQPITPYISRDKKACMAILPPQSGRAIVKIVLTGGIQKEAEFDANLIGSKITTVNVNIPKDKPVSIELVLDNSTIIDWTSEEDLPFYRI